MNNGDEMPIEIKTIKTKPGVRRGGAVGAALMHIALVIVILGVVAITVLLNLHCAAGG